MATRKKTNFPTFGPLGVVRSDIPCPKCGGAVVCVASSACEKGGPRGSTIYTGTCIVCLNNRCSYKVVQASVQT
jgi:hypothetical protein